LNRLRFIIEDIEHGEELGDLQDFLGDSRKIQQFHISVTVARGCVRRNEFTKAGTIDMINLPEIYNEFSAPVFHKAPDRIPQQQNRLSRVQLTGHVHDDHILNFARVQRKRHNSPSESGSIGRTVNEPKRIGNWSLQLATNVQ
jgi:hypothetical protein